MVFATSFELPATDDGRPLIRVGGGPTADTRGHELRAEPEERGTADTEYVEPSNPTEARPTELLGEVVGDRASFGAELSPGRSSKHPPTSSARSCPDQQTNP